MAARTLGDLDTFPKLMAHNVDRFGDAPAYRVKEYGIWQSWSWREAHAEMRALAVSLQELGLQPGDHVALIGSNRPELYIAMTAISAAGGVPVPIYQDGVAEEISYVLDHCSARFAICDDQEQVDKVLEVKEQLPDLRELIYRDPRGLRRYDHTHLHALDALIESGREATADQNKRLDDAIASRSADDTCVMLYTSGTTGRPKGVVLSNRNILVTSMNSAEFDHLRQSDVILAYLPMAWVGDFIFSMGQAQWTGFCVCCPESEHTMQTDLREVGPTYFFGPPRFFEGLLTNVMIRMEDATKLKQRLFHHFMDVAKRVGPQMLDGKPVGFGDRVQYALGEAMVYGPLKNTLGMSKVRVGYTAGEAIGPEIFEFYRSLGINLKQLYGQTEASVFIAQQPDGEVRADTVGVASPDVELRIAENGEVFYRSPGSFVEYFKNPDSTASTKDAEGWVATGDAGFVEEETGHLRIIDRAKDVGQMADGSLFAPKYVENKLKFFPNILEAVVFGNGRSECTAFLNIDLGSVGNWAERNNIAYASYQELAQHPQVLSTLKAHVEEVNASVAEDEMLAGCQIHRFLVLHKQLDADDGELTRTQKVRRRIIEERYGDLIAALYDGSDEVFADTEVTYEDGRKGRVKGTLKVIDAATVPVATKWVAAE
ncbi:AMP-binding protein [Roseobacter sp. HKCCA0434]|uniref:AMP-binding protein n=1 Tax=Roseobacter sp. HKCCA0434 TaxID=3079297 RepID=UPI0029057E28|nr:AMP-binding protein [Roseobacter sp. HKCCA0434]